MLYEELAWHKAVLPDGDDAGVVNGVAQFRQCHVKFVHS